VGRHIFDSGVLDPLFGSVIREGEVLDLVTVYVIVQLEEDHEAGSRKDGVRRLE
jgi:hypothetical protein